LNNLKKASTWKKFNKISGDYLSGEFVRQVKGGIVRHQTERDGFGPVFGYDSHQIWQEKIEMTECGSWVK